MGQRALLALALLASCAWGSARAQGERPWVIFGGLHGDFELRYERTDIGSPSNPSDPGQDYAFVFEELHLRQRIALYHPRFVDISLGLGLELGQGRGDREGTDSRRTSYSVLARILKQHPYSGTVHLRKSETDFEQSPTSISTFVQRDRGASLTLREEAAPTPGPLTLSLRRVERQSDNLFTNVNLQGIPSTFFALDETTDTVSLRTHKRWESVDYRLTGETRDVTRIQVTDTGPSRIAYERDDYTANLAGRAGEDDWLRWKLRASGQEQSAFPRYRQRNVQEEARVRLYDVHATTLDSLVQLSHTRTEREIGNNPLLAGQQTEEIKTDRGTVGLDHRLFKSLYTRLRYLREKARFFDHTRTVEERSLATSYAKKIPGGNVAAAYSVALRREEETGGDIAFVNDEAHVLTDFDDVTLGSPAIVLTSVAVTDLTGEIVYQEGIDYRIFQIGLETFLERVPGSRIVNGDTVLVDYSYLVPGGISEQKTTSYSLSGHWVFIDPYYRVTRLEETVLEGEPVLSNPGTTTTYGVRLRYTFQETLTPEAKFEREDSARRFDPFERRTREAGLGYVITLGVKANVSYGRTEIDFAPTDPAVDPTTNNRIEQVSRKASLTYRRGRLEGFVARNETSRQVADSIREVDTTSARMSVFYGQWTLSVAGTFADEEFRDASPASEDFVRERDEVRIGLKRTF